MRKKRSAKSQRNRYIYRPRKVLHVEFPEVGRPFDARPIFAEMNKAKARGLLPRLSPKVEKELGALSLHLATRAGILKRCVELNGELLQQSIDAVMSNTRELLRLDYRTLYSLLLFVDSFLFECRAYDGLLRQFFLKILRNVLGRSKQQAESKYAELSRQCGNINGEAWTEFLEDKRNIFSHVATPWIAVDLSRQEEQVYDFLIMSENIEDFTKATPDSYFPVVKDFNLVIHAIQIHAEAVEKFLKSRFTSLRA